MFQKLPWLLLLFLFPLMACGSAQNRREVPPKQSDVDAVIQGLTRDVEDIAFKLLPITDCNQFNQAVAGIPETIQCAQGGSANTTVGNVRCDDGPPLQASVEVTVSSNQCTFEGKSTVGDLMVLMAIDGSTITGTAAATGIVIIGIQFDFNDITVTLDQDGMAVSCTGTASAFDFPCTVSADCMTCPLDT